MDGIRLHVTQSCFEESSSVALSVVLADCTQVLSESFHHRLSNWNPLQSLPLHFTDENSREVMWFIQAQKAYMYGSCMYSKIKKIQQWGKSGSNELDTNKRLQTTVHIGVGIRTLEKVQSSVSEGPKVLVAESTLLSGTSFKFENVAWPWWVKGFKNQLHCLPRTMTYVQKNCWPPFQSLMHYI